MSLSLTLLTAPPPALTPSELAEISAATPASFEGIAPLLRHLENEVDFTIEPAVGGFGGGKGELFITEGALSFYSAATSTGITIPYPLITLHAISRAPLRSLSANSTETVGGGPCIYCQIDESEGADDEGDEDNTREVIIIPTNAESLDKIFETLSTCASLHPPTMPADGGYSAFGGLDADSMVYADADGNLVGGGVEQMTAEEEADELSSAGRAARNHLESIIQWPAGSTNGKTAGDA